MAERESALVAFARGTAGHTWGVDSLVDDVVKYTELGWLPRPGAGDDQMRNYAHLAFVYKRAKSMADKEFLAKLLGGK